MSTETMRLSGHAGTFSLTADAHRRVLGYLAAARSQLGDDPVGDETVRDLESALGEHLRSLVRREGEPLGESQVAGVLEALGEIDADGNGGFARPGTHEHAVRGPFWCHIVEGKWFGGICVGISARGGFRLDWVRTLAFFLLLVSGGILGLVYLGMLLALPRVDTIAEYHRLEGEPRSARGPGRRGR